MSLHTPKTCLGYLGLRICSFSPCASFVVQFWVSRAHLPGGRTRAIDHPGFALRPRERVKRCGRSGAKRRSGAWQEWNEMMPELEVKENHLIVEAREAERWLCFWLAR